MATVAKEENTSIVVTVAENPALVLVDAGKRDDLFAHIRREIEAFEPDVSTNKGRDAIKSFAFKITRTKTAIDAAGKQLNEEARAKIDAVDAARRAARAELDAMAEEVRRPLTEWENAEKARAECADGLIRAFKEAAVVTLDDTADSVRERGTVVWKTEVGEELGDLRAGVLTVKQETVATLQSALERLTREEEERAELERLRQAEAERIAREAAEREQREAEERAAAEAKAAEDRRVAAEKAEAERIERAKEEAAQAARDEADRKARAEQEERDRQHAAELQAERDRADEVERQRKAEADRIAEIEREREEREAAERAEAKRIADQKAADEANKALQRRLKTEAKEAVMACGVSEDAAQKIVLAVRAREIPHIVWEA